MGGCGVADTVRSASYAVFKFSDGNHSILTTTLLRNSDGSFRIWYASRKKAVRKQVLRTEYGHMVRSPADRENVTVKIFGAFRAARTARADLNRRSIHAICTFGHERPKYEAAGSFSCDVPVRFGQSLR